MEAESLVSIIALGVAFVSALTSIAAVRQSARMAKLNTLMVHSQQWVKFDYELAVNKGFREAFARIIPENAPVLNEETRVVFYFLSNAQNSFHLRQAGLIEKNEYEHVVRSVSQLLEGEHRKILDEMESHGFPKKFADDIRRAGPKR